MSQSSLLLEIANLSVAERIALVEKIWDSIATSQEILPPTEAQRAELDRRLDEQNNGVGGTERWEQVKREILGDE